MKKWMLVVILGLMIMTVCLAGWRVSEDYKTETALDAAVDRMQKVDPGDLAAVLAACQETMDCSLRKFSAEYKGHHLNTWYINLAYYRPSIIPSGQAHLAGSAMVEMVERPHIHRLQ